MSTHENLRTFGSPATYRLLPETNVGRSRARALHHAVFALALAHPEFSARYGVTRRQIAALVWGVGVLVAAFFAWSRLMAQAVVGAMALGFLVSLALRAVLVCAGRSLAVPRAATRTEDLPVYTILIPLYREAEILPQLAGAIAALDYPRDRLDTLFIIEEDDTETLAVAQALGLREIIVVPFSEPRTKPKACNYALQFARGKHLVIFDAEDRPEPDQLRKAVEAFRANPDVACFQARLCIDDGSSWLPATFGLDYGIWFNTLLPGLVRLRAPIPLGGTSNHFRTDILVAAGAWDPFNVTEDADLGCRLARLGHRVSMLDSVTYEEAPRKFRQWLRQRTRWMKGYMQTLLVHTRQPAVLLREIGPNGSLLLHAFLGGAIWSALVNPLLWVVFVAGLLDSGSSTLGVLASIAGIGLTAGNILLAVLSFVGQGCRRRPGTLAFLVLYPLYWLFISVAAYRALWQLRRDPFHWEKTPHGAASCAS